MLTLAAFRRLISAYGAAPARWPDAQRQAANALLASSAEARALLRREEALDSVLASLALPQPDEADLARLRAGVAARLCAPAPSRLGWLPALPRWSWLTAGASGAVAAGLVVGLLSASLPTAPSLLSALQPSAIPGITD